MNKQHTYKIIILLILTISLTNTTQAETQDIELIQTHVTIENTKTRTELTKYTDRKIGEMITTLKKDGEKYVNDNFAVFDARIHDLAKKLQVQIAITLFCIIILSQATWLMIKRKIEKKEQKINPKITKDNLTANKYGLTSEEFKTKINKEDKTVIKQETLSATSETIKPPEMTEIERMLRNKRQQEEEEQIKEEEEQLRKAKIEEGKKLKEINKIKDKMNTKTRGLQNKLRKLEEKANIPKSKAATDVLPPLPPK